MEAIHNPPPFQLGFFEDFTVFPPLLLRGLKSGIMLCTFPFSMLVVDVDVTENSG